MTEYITRAQEFETPAEALAHYGVKGMKWGVTNADVRGAPSKAEISDARLRVAGKNVKYHQQRAKIKRSDVGRGQKKDQLKDLKVKTLSDPDRMTAMRLTRGEKAAVAIFTIVAPPVGVSIAAQRVDISRQLNKAQKQQAARTGKR